MVLWRAQGPCHGFLRVRACVRECSVHAMEFWAVDICERHICERDPRHIPGAKARAGILMNLEDVGVDWEDRQGLTLLSPLDNCFVQVSCVWLFYVLHCFNKDRR